MYLYLVGLTSRAVSLYDSFIALFKTSLRHFFLKSPILTAVSQRIKKSLVKLDSQVVLVAIAFPITI